MSTATQENRLMAVTTPLGEDVLLLTGFSGHEALSQLFSYQLDLLSEEEDISPQDIVGQNITWRLSRQDQEPRYFNGVVSRFAAGSRDLRGLRSYRVEVVPWLWFLTRTADCRIEQNKTTPEIVQTVFRDHGFRDFELSLRREYRTWEYCVQYRETAFNFVARLLEQEGIFYSFRHEDGKHTLVLADHKGVYRDGPESSVGYVSDSREPNLLDSWEHRYEFRSGKWTETDYNFETPATNLLASTETLIDLPRVETYEVFDYPGEYRTRAEGDADTRVRMEEEEVAHDVVSASSRCSTFTPGGRFTVAEHDIEAEVGKKYVITAIQHAAREASYDGGGGSVYHNTFSCIPATVLFRPARLTPKPFVQGTQTAVVVGPSGEEIHTDRYGRVKVQFHWDRRGRRDENSSCWVRVATPWAGQHWGMIHIPRVGQEVVVDFQEGDPDRPLILGSVYNAEQMPPYTLPEHKTRSGLKTRSSRNGEAAHFNELRFEDKKGAEDIHFHAEMDFHRVVENNDDLRVGHDQTIEVKNKRTATVKEGDEKLTLEKGNREVLIQMGKDTLQIKMGDQTTKIDLGKSETEAMQSIELKVGQSSIKLDQTGVTIRGLTVKVEGQVQTEVKGLMTQISGDAMLQAKGGVTMIG